MLRPFGCLLALTFLGTSTVRADWASSYKVFKDSSAAPAERIKASEELAELIPQEGFRPSPADIESIQGLALNPQAGVELRKAAISVLYLLGPQALQPPAKKLAADPEAPEPLRKHAFDTLRTVANFEATGPQKADISKALAPVLDRPNDPLYSNVVQYLIPEGNTKAIEAAQQAIKDPGKSGLKAADAILGLSNQDRTKYFADVRPALKSDDDAVRGLAVEFLGADMNSRDQIRSYFTNPQQPVDVRKKAAKALANHDAAFPSYALDSLSKNGEAYAADLQAYAIRQVGHAACNGAYAGAATKSIELNDISRIVQELKAKGKHPAIDSAVDKVTTDIQRLR